MKDGVDLPQEEEVKRAAEMREWLESKIFDLEQDLSRLRTILMLVDSTLRRHSFVSAKELRNVESLKPQLSKPLPSKVEEKKLPPREESAHVSKVRDDPETRELRRTPDGEVLASVLVKPEKIVITPSANLKLSENIPPFKSFFVNRILKGYQSKDLETSKAGNLSPTEVLQYDVKEKDGIITEVTVMNYRDKSRLTEILNTAAWAFSRMLEKK